MKKILILVEGQTEERFVKDILNPEISTVGLYATPTIINTKIVKGGAHFKGGVNSYSHVKRDLVNLLGDTSAIAVTTMFDFYHLPTDFPTWLNSGNCYQKVNAAEMAFSSDIANPKFIPYLQLHEFEGLLFSAPIQISNTFGGLRAAAMQAIRDLFGSPEEINHGPTTHPSRRLLDNYPNYSKVVFGSLIAGRIGFGQICSNCPHFNDWVNALKARK